MTGAACADVIFLENGDRITGTIKRVWDGELFIESDYADEFAVSLQAVARIESDGEFDIELRNDEELTGRFSVDESGAMVVVTGDSVVPLPAVAIEEMNEPEQHFDWETRSDFSLSGSRGNAETSDFLWQAFGRLKLGDHRHELDLRLNRIEQDGLVTKEQYNSRYQYSWFFAERWFLGAGVGYERDPVRQLTQRVTPGVGLGFQPFDDAGRQLEMSLSAIGVREKLAGVTTDSSTARWQLRYRKDVTEDLEFFHDQQFSVYLTGRSNRIADTSTGIRWDVWEDVYLNAQLEWNWESEPAAGSEPTDLSYALGIGIELD